MGNTSGVETLFPQMLVFASLMRRGSGRGRCSGILGTKDSQCLPFLYSTDHCFQEIFLKCSIVK